MGGMGKALCLLPDWSQCLGQRESYFSKILQAISLKLGKSACSLYQMLPTKEVGEKKFESHLKNYLIVIHRKKDDFF